MGGSSLAVGSVQGVQSCVICVLAIGPTRANEGLKKTGRPTLMFPRLSAAWRRLNYPGQ
jgi:hypothetical protein